MSKRKTYYEYQNERQQLLKQRPGMRHNDSLVAVNPERVTTLLELAIEHYGKKCARCGSTKDLCVHHRHYCTVGFEKPERDIVLLCWNCHTDLHTRSKQKRLNKDDIPFVDPRWESSLSKISPTSSGWDPSWNTDTVAVYCALYRDKAGQEWVSIEDIADRFDPPKELEAVVSMLDLAELVEYKCMARLTWDELETMYVELSPGVEDLDTHPNWERWNF